MKTPIKSLLALSVLAIILAACGTTAVSSPEATTSPPPSVAPSDAPSEAPSDAPSEAPSEPADAPRTVAGTITFVGGASVSGPGGSITEALASGMTEPMLVNGVFFMDEDGQLYLAESLEDASAPTFGEPLLRVLEYPSSPDTWDMANAELTGLQEANGILFFENNQLYGVVEG